MLLGTETCFYCKKIVVNYVPLNIGSSIVALCITCDDKAERDFDSEEYVEEEAFV